MKKQELLDLRQEIQPVINDLDLVMEEYYQKYVTAKNIKYYEKEELQTRLRQAEMEYVKVVTKGKVELNKIIRYRSDHPSEYRNAWALGRIQEIAVNDDGEVRLNIKLCNNGYTSSRDIQNFHGSRSIKTFVDLDWKDTRFSYKTVNNADSDLRICTICGRTSNVNNKNSYREYGFHQKCKPCEKFDESITQHNINSHRSCLTFIHKGKTYTNKHYITHDTELKTVTVGDTDPNNMNYALHDTNETFKWSEVKDLLVSVHPLIAEKEKAKEEAKNKEATELARREISIVMRKHGVTKKELETLLNTEESHA
jgi:NACalpha-BTF3-like transcription factor